MCWYGKCNTSLRLQIFEGDVRKQFWVPAGKFRVGGIRTLFAWSVDAFVSCTTKCGRVPSRKDCMAAFWHIVYIRIDWDIHGHFNLNLYWNIICCQELLFNSMLIQKSMCFSGHQRQWPWVFSAHCVAEGRLWVDVHPQQFANTAYELKVWVCHQHVLISKHVVRAVWLKICNKTWFIL